MFTRIEHGSLPVTREGKRWHLHMPDGTVQEYATARALLSYLTGHPQGRHWSIARYFGLTRKSSLGEGDILEQFEVEWAQPPQSPLTFDIRKSGFHRNLKRRVGIDLKRRSQEVRKLLFAGFGNRILSSGYDPEDVLQEVYRGILARNQGTCPWDPKKSSFGHYVHLVCSCIVSNYHRKMKRVRSMEQTGILSYGEDGGREMSDVSTASHLPAKESRESSQQKMGEVVEDLSSYLSRKDSAESRLARRILPYLAEGYSRSDLCDKLGVSLTAVNRAVSHLRQETKKWHMKGGSH
jgi:DNA-directed RNA polymerase specialized sigma24 family protein